jgi:hypothetical protein
MMCGAALDRAVALFELAGNSDITGVCAAGALVPEAQDEPAARTAKAITVRIAATARVTPRSSRR